ncbi:MAG: hypothetical protein ACOZBZ_01840 [Patescibacteria group bacterium]
MRKTAKDLLLLGLTTIFSTLLVWFPFSLGLGKGMLSVFANYDGPNYIIVAKTLYNKTLIGTSFSLPLPLEYYPAHLPGYPLLIKFFNLFLPGTWAMLSVTLFTTILAVSMFYLFVKKFNLSTPASSFFLSLLFLFLPARWLVVRSIGSPEPLFIFAILASFYFFKSAFEKKESNLFLKYKSVTLDFFLAGLFGAIAQITKTPGILLFVAYLIYLGYHYLNHRPTDTKSRYSVCLCHKITWFNLLPLFLIPLSILPVFWFYKIQTGDFLAYFHSGDNFHLVFPPLQSFVTGRNWLGDFWLEDMIFIYLFGALTVVLLFKQKLYDLATFALVFFTATLFVAHRDLSRYSLPLAPFYLLAFSPFLEKKEFKIAFFFILIPIYLYAINFILHNTAPVADWTPYL